MIKEDAGRPSTSSVLSIRSSVMEASVLKVVADEGGRAGFGNQKRGGASKFELGWFSTPSESSDSSSVGVFTLMVASDDEHGEDDWSGAAMKVGSGDSLTSVASKRSFVTGVSVAIAVLVLKNGEVESVDLGTERGLLRKRLDVEGATVGVKLPAILLSHGVRSGTGWEGQSGNRGKRGTEAAATYQPRTNVLPPCIIMQHIGPVM